VGFLFTIRVGFQFTVSISPFINSFRVHVKEGADLFDC